MSPPHDTNAQVLHKLVLLYTEMDRFCMSPPHDMLMRSVLHIISTVIY